MTRLPMVGTPCVENPIKQRLPALPWRAIFHPLIQGGFRFSGGPRQGLPAARHAGKFGRARVNPAVNPRAIPTGAIPGGSAAQVRTDLTLHIVRTRSQGRSFEA